MQLMVEGGGEVHRSFLAADLVDELHVFYGACVLGGEGASGQWLSGVLCPTIAQARFWHLDQVSRVGEHDVHLCYLRRTPSAGLPADEVPPGEVSADMATDDVSADVPASASPASATPPTTASPASATPSTTASAAMSHAAPPGAPQGGWSAAEVERSGVRVGVAYTRWNEEAVGAAVAAVCTELRACGVGEGDTLLLEVAGSWELAYAAQTLAETGEVDAVVAVGVLVKGDTLHFEVISHAVASALAAVQRRCRTPVIYGVLNCLSAHQALPRCSPAVGGARSLPASWARAAVHMATLKRDPARLIRRV
jgi:6,7-dimethyl-8-ribityllumazine synthase